MGIKNLNAFLKENFPDAFYCSYLDELAGNRIAIDAPLYFHQVISTANKSYILQMKDPLDEIDKYVVLKKSTERLLFFLLQLTNASIIPIFVWDGKKTSVKDACIEKRIEAKENISEKIFALKEELLETDILFRSKVKLQELRNLLTQQNGVVKNDLDYYRDLISELGFPSITAESEGEKLCSYLAKNGYISAVWSLDTDNFPLGTPIMITGIETIENAKSDNERIIVSITNFKEIKKGLNKTNKWIIDFCIMCGCDFNTNVPGIGIKRSYDFMKNYDSLDDVKEYNFPIPKKDREQYDNRLKFTNEECLNFLNIAECRIQFEHEEILIDQNELNFNYEKFVSFVEQCNEFNFLPLLNSVAKIKDLNPKKIIPIKKSRFS